MAHATVFPDVNYSYWAGKTWTLFQWIVTGGAGGTIVALYQHYRKTSAEKRKAASLVFLFTLESVRLFSRFAQYVHQILVDRRVSKSRPFQLVPETELARLIEMGVDRHVLESIYNIRELNSLVTLQVDHAHEVRDEMIQQVRVPAGGTVKVLPAQREFDRIYAFVTGEYAKIVSSVELLLQESERRSGKMANVDLRKEFSEALNKIKSDEEKKDKNALLIGERHDLG